MENNSENSQNTTDQNSNQTAKTSFWGFLLKETRNPYFLDHVIIGATIAILSFLDSSDSLILVVSFTMFAAVSLYSLGRGLYDRYKEEKKPDTDTYLKRDFVHIASDTGIFPEMIRGIAILAMFLLHVKLDVIVGVGYMIVLVTSIFFKPIEIYTDPDLPRNKKSSDTVENTDSLQNGDDNQDKKKADKEALKSVLRKRLGHTFFLDHIIMGVAGMILFCVGVHGTVIAVVPFFLAIALGIIDAAANIKNKREKNKKARKQQEAELAKRNQEGEQDKKGSKDITVKEVLHIISDTAIIPEVVTGIAMLILFLLKIKFAAIFGIGFVVMTVATLLAKALQIYTDPKLPKRKEKKSSADSVISNNPATIQDNVHSGEAPGDNTLSASIIANNDQNLQRSSQDNAVSDCMETASKQQICTERQIDEIDTIATATQEGISSTNTQNVGESMESIKQDNANTTNENKVDILKNDSDVSLHSADYKNKDICQTDDSSCDSTLSVKEQTALQSLYRHLSTTANNLYHDSISYSYSHPRLKQNNSLLKKIFRFA